VIYVPEYNPEYIWGPPVWGVYPPLWYPSFGFGFGPACYLGGFFAGFGGWGGWGWGLGWFGRGIFLNGAFFNHYGFHGYDHFGRGAVWAHNPYHRLGVPYQNHGIGAGFNRGGFNGRTANPGGWRSFNGGGGGQFNSRSNWQPVGRQQSGMTRGFQPENRMGQGGFTRSAPSQSYRAPAQAQGSRSFSNPAQRGVAPSYRSAAPPMSHYSAPSQQHFSAPAQHFSAPHYSAPRSSGGGHFSAPHSSGGHSGGGSHHR